MKLHELYADGESLKVIKDYLKAFVAEYGLKKMLDREDVSGVADANDIIDQAFDHIEIKLGKQDKPEKSTGQSPR